MSEPTILAIPSVGDGGLEAERSGHFGHCDCFTLVEISDNKIAGVRVVANPPHVQGSCLTPVTLLASPGVNALIAAGMGARPLSGFNDAGITVYFENQTPGIGDVVQRVLDGTVEIMNARDACGGGHSH